MESRVRPDFRKKRKAGPTLVRPLLPTIGGSLSSRTELFPDPEASG
jgi:hypothetical protein